MASRWQGLVDQLNEEFKKGPKLKATGKKFRRKHKGAGSKPYKFGHFVADDFTPEGHGKPALDTKASADLLIDAGSRHFEPASAKLLEDTVIESLSTEDKEIPIDFIIDDTTLLGPLATVKVERELNATGETERFKVTVYCVP